MGGGVILEQSVVVGLLVSAPVQGRAEEGPHIVRDKEAGFRGPAQIFLGQGQFLVAQRLAVDLGGALAVGAAIADGGATADQAGPGIGLGGFDGRGDRRAVHAVHTLHMPAVRLEALGPIFRVGQIRAAFDGDVVVVIEIDELAQLEVAGQTGGLAGNALHQIPVPTDGVDVMVHHVEAGAVVALGQPALGHSHAHARGKTLAQRTGRGLDARSVAIFRMARCLAPPLAEVFQLFQRQVVAGEVEQAVEQHGAMPGAEDEAVPVAPLGVGRVVAQEVGPQSEGGLGHAHWHPRVAGVGGLHTIRGQHADGVDGLAFEVRVKGWGG